MTEKENNKRDQDEHKFYKILIADDEQEVHTITKLVLRNYEFSGSKLEFLDSYSGKETIEILEKEKDVALILLDVVMEEEKSGLEVAKWIRKDLKNKFIRIILRTGQPGSAPEKEVITEYDINDYKEKTELTAQKLFTTVTASIRAYRDLKIIDKNKKGLEKIIIASAKIFEFHSLRKFAEGVLTQLTSLLNFDENSLYIQSSGFAIKKENERYQILAGTGNYSECDDKCLNDVVNNNILKLIEDCAKNKKSMYVDNTYIGYFKTQNSSENLLYLEGNEVISEIDRKLIDIFSSNISVAFDNIYLNQDIENTQQEIIYTLGEAVESKSQEKGHHVKRIAYYSKLLAEKLELTDEDVDLIFHAAPMHDIGKIAIAESVLKKQEKLSESEFEEIKNHTNFGKTLLNESHKNILYAASVIALSHHEKWDGTGYPKNLKGEEIPLFARIVALADVFDSLSHKKVYKKAWELDDVIDYIKENKGTQFDPKIVDIFINNIDGIVDIFNKYPD